MHHARHRQIHALGAAVVERVRCAMREQSAGSRTEQVFLRHPAARQQGMPGHGLAGRRGFCFARTRPLAQGERAPAGLWPGSRGRACGVGTRNSRQRKFHLSGGRTKHRQPAIAENLHGEIIGNRTNPKYDSVVYRIPFFYEAPRSS